MMRGDGAGTGSRRRMLSRAEAAEWFGLSPKTLETWAHKGRGPRYAIVGKHAKYRLEDLEEFVAERMVEPSRG